MKAFHVKIRPYTNVNVVFPQKLNHLALMNMKVYTRGAQPFEERGPLKRLSNQSLAKMSGVGG